MTDHRREMLEKIADYLDWCYSEYASKVVKETHIAPSQNFKVVGHPPYKKWGIGA